MVDRVVVTFNGSFSGAGINDDVGALIRQAFQRDPTAFWTVSGSGAVTMLRSAVNGDFGITKTAQLAPDSPVQIGNFPIARTAQGTRATDGSGSAIPNENPIFQVFPPTGDIGERPPIYVSPTFPFNSSIVDRGVLMEAILNAAIGPTCLLYTSPSPRD